ncbi:beta-ketoacyl synthase N-terminal-like domain-containing protein [Alkalimonas collagenimarina]|uniref:Beta-ketoacyl synthase N-terminal-like domain-containing protein n=1 Tax=Alkalimonas collagenimarina TaxID=400390 RepID=A0ABT9H0W6_9GAMM|nr:beta-ketoacyl synthase N-terminal-like domain-containing protein [Alkalimonas collagenimarina]MDP4536956.1 beta-ketoacyl synthase N-terminal-like domain-containing protein [Alkalimonas collagenimarina]
MDIEKQRLAIKDFMREYAKKHTAQSADIDSAEAGHTDSSELEPIAIVGLEGYLPGCQSVAEFWQHLDKDESLIEEIPQSRFDWRLYANEAPTWDAQPDKMRCRWGGFIPDIQSFDPHFFKLLPDDAQRMDPQQRLLLMSVYNTLENAGYRPQALKGSNTGVFVGFERNEYLLNLIESGYDTGESLHQSDSMIANNISYYFDFSGPSEVVNTMCSSAAVAIHRAVVALRTGEIDQAIVGAANLLLRPDTFVKLSQTQQMSPTPTVKSFGDDADGYLRAEGVASILLKPYSRARKDGDAIYAVIKSSAVNYNGNRSASIAAPNTSAHASLIQACYAQANIDPREVDYIEAQGMGNPVSDICEWDAFNLALNNLAQQQGVALRPAQCKVSTLKPMIGHMHSASSLGALFKVIHSLQSEKIHKILGIEQISADIDTEHSVCQLATETIPWPKKSGNRLAGIHAYGAGGNNAHVLIAGVDWESEPTVKEAAEGEQVWALPVSALNKACFTAQLTALQAALRQCAYPISHLAFTLRHGRDSHAYRCIFLASSREQLLQQIEDVLDARTNANVFEHGHSQALGERDQPIAAQWLETGHCEWPEMSSEGRQRVHLPGTQFNLKEYWIAPDIAPQAHDTSMDITLEPAPTDADEQRIADILIAILAEHLRVSEQEIDLEREFSDMGFDSLLVSRVSKALSAKLATQIAPAVLFEATTPAKLIDHCKRHFQQATTGASSRGKLTVRKTSFTRQPIAIIGLAGQYPDADNVFELWQNLAAGKSSIREIPNERWPIANYFDTQADGEGDSFKSAAKWGGFLDGLNYFDNEFFNLPPFEAAYMSPKERLFMQCAWHVVEDAGYTTKTLERDTVGVFVGISKAGFDNYKDSYFSAANRISYRFNFGGPSMPVDTACSSSLSAIHEACLHLYAGECDVAVAGGVNAYTHPSTFAEFTRLNVLSKDGTLSAFGAQANGFVPGEGVGAVLLKPLAKAIADGDHIYGVIRGTAINHGGKVNGYTVPSPLAQQNLIRTALSRAGLCAADINYVEAHGTGTLLGDPVEFKGLDEAYKADTSAQQFCALGSVKTNIGHLEAAAGIAGLTKVLLQMHHKKLAPTLNAEQSNPHIDFAASAFKLQQTLTDWQLDTTERNAKRRAGVSSFGAGGSNAHIVVEEAPISTQSSAPESSYLFVLSAKSGSGLARYVDKYIDFLSEQPSLSLANMSYTLQAGREAMPYRLACEFDSLEALLEMLKAYKQGTACAQLWQGQVDKHRGVEALFQESSAQALVRHWLAERKFQYIAELWTQGGEIDWHPGKPAQYQRVSLPGYPFAQIDIPKAPMLVPVTAHGHGALAPSTTDSVVGMLLMTLSWRALDETPHELLDEDLEQHIVLCDYPALSALDGMVHLSSSAAHPAASLTQFCIQLTARFDAIIRSKCASHKILQVVVPKEPNLQSTLPAMSALLKTCSLENDNVTGQLIELPVNLPQEQVFNLLAQAKRHAHCHWFKAEAEHLMACDLDVLDTISVPHPWRDQGVYLITGGLGQLGYLCACDIAQKVQAPILILTGQRPLDTLRENQLARLKEMGATVHYEAVDLTALDAVTILVQNTVRAHGGINAVLHCAGVIQDGLLRNKDAESIRHVLAPKTYGAWHLGQACEEIKLEHFVLFSSAVSMVGNVGQGDYAAANAFLDLYAQQRQQRVNQGLCFGQSCAIGWGLWRDGGMQVSDDILAALYDMSGMQPIDSDVGLSALYQVMHQTHTRTIAIAGDTAKLAHHFSRSIGAAQPVAMATKTTQPDHDQVQRELMSRFIAAAAAVVGVAQSALDLHVGLDEQGFGIVELHAIINELNQHFDYDFSLNTANVYRTLHDLLDAYSDALTGKTKVQGHTGALSSADDDVLLASVCDQLTMVLSQVTGYAKEKLAQDTGFDELGIDSLVVTKLTNKLEFMYGALPKTLFFEHHTIAQLAEYLFTAHRSQLETYHTPPPSSSDAHRATSLHESVEPQRSSVAGAYTDHSRDAQDTDIAIIGISGRYPQANTLQAFWQVLAGGQDCITEVPTSRWSHRHYYDEEKGKPGKTYAKWGGFIDGVDKFDPSFFNISPREAEIIEPQERLFLQTAYEAIEDAGYTRTSLAQTTALDGSPGAVGVYVGVTYQEYQLYGAQETMLGRPMVLSMSPSSIANRVSYFCDFHGPSLAIDTMCASSLTSIHLACQSLLSGECKAAIAGGVNVSIHPAKYLMLGYGGFASQTGRCKTFSAEADGFVPSEGVGAVLLKPLREALQAGDHIYGVIKGSAVNHGGRTYGYSVPSPMAQQAVIARALAQAKVKPQQISYVEAHGTGTSLGDPIEVAALNKAFSAGDSKDRVCAIGSVKSNIGHCESAAGIAGLTKVLLQMKHQQLVPSLHSEQINPKIEFAQSPFVVQQQLAPWPSRDDAPRIAGVSSFGAGGSNAHLIVQEAPEQAELQGDKRSHVQVITLSARSHAQLKEMASNLLHHLRREHLSQYDAQRIAYTLQTGRETFDHRLACIVIDLTEIQAGLALFLAADSAPAASEIWLNGTVCMGVVDDTQAQSAPLDPSFLGTISSTDEAQKDVRCKALVSAWSRGADIQWSVLYHLQSPRKISLPTYPFAAKRYWKPASDEALRAQRVNELSHNTPVLPAPQEPKSGKIQLVEPHVFAVKKAALPTPAQSGEKVPAPAPQPDSPVEAVTASDMPNTHASEDTDTFNKTFLRASLARALMMNEDEISDNTPFSNIGLDSIVGVEWVRAINAQYKLALAVERIHEYPSINQLHAYLLQSGEGETLAAQPEVRETRLSTPAQAETADDAAVINTVISTLANALLLDAGDIRAQSRFVDLGLDSIVGVEWIRAINAHFGTQIEANAVYEHPTPAAFAQYLTSLFAEPQTSTDEAAKADSTVSLQAPNEYTTLDFLRTSLATVLMMAELEIKVVTRFADLGLDSITGMEWIKVINQTMQLSLNADIVYEHNTLESFSGYIQSQLESKGMQHTQEIIQALQAVQRSDEAAQGTHLGVAGQHKEHKQMEEVL